MQANHTGRGIPDNVGGNEEIDHQVMQDLQRQSTGQFYYVRTCMYGCMELAYNNMPITCAVSSVQTTLPQSLFWFSKHHDNHFSLFGSLISWQYAEPRYVHPRAQASLCLD